MRPNKWIKIWIIMTTTLLILSSMANFIINPYDIYSMDLFNFKKVAIYNKLREIEPIKIKQTKAIFDYFRNIKTKIRHRCQS